MAKINCIILGYQNSGKTTLLNYLQQQGFSIFNTDNFIHQNLYQKDQLGYLFIKRNIGAEFVNHLYVDRYHLKQYLKKFPNKLIEISHFVNKEINRQILTIPEQVLFIELPTYFDYQEDFDFEIQAYIFLKKKNEIDSLFHLHKFDKIYSLIEKYFINSDLVCFYKLNQIWIKLELNELITILNNKEK